MGTEGTGADSTITIEVVKNKDQAELTIKVVDQESSAPLAGVVVKLTDPDHPGVPPITGSPDGGSHTTDAKGIIVIELFPDPVKRYQIKVSHTGYQPYVGDIFTINADTEKRVELVKQTPAPGGDDDDYHWVYYHAGAGGGLDGVEREQVGHNASPKKVPTPIPDEGYAFAGWMLDGKFLEPEALKVSKTVRLYAVFEFQSVPVPTPTPTVPPTPPSNPTPTPTAEPPAESGGPQPPDRPWPGPPDQGGSDGPSGGTIGPTDHGGPTTDHGGPTTDHSGPTPDVNETDPGPSAPVLGPGIEEPAADDGHDHTQCRIHWWILLCVALTAALGLLRLWAVHRRIRELERAVAEEEKELTLT